MDEDDEDGEGGSSEKKKEDGGDGDVTGGSSAVDVDEAGACIELYCAIANDMCSHADEIGAVIDDVEIESIRPQLESMLDEMTSELLHTSI